MTAEEKLKNAIFYSPFNDFRSSINNVVEINANLSLNYDLYFTEIKRLGKKDDNTYEEVESAEKFRRIVEAEVAKLKKQAEKMEHLLEYI
jgi:pyruvate-formate lyase-activating enzyme